MEAIDKSFQAREEMFAKVKHHLCKAINKIKQSERELNWVIRCFSNFNLTGSKLLCFGLMGNWLLDTLVLMKLKEGMMQRLTS